MFSELFSESSLQQMGLNAIVTFVVGFMIITGQRKALWCRQYLEALGIVWFCRPDKSLLVESTPSSDAWLFAL